jgi:hypothetical protein
VAHRLLIAAGMRNHHLLLLALSAALTACATSPAPITDEDLDALTAPDTRLPATAIKITSGSPLALVAYRDDADPTWHTATQQSPTRFTAKVHGSYWVSAVCTTTQLDGTTAVILWQIASTLEDSHDLAFPFCPSPATTHTVSGQIAQGASIILDGSETFADDPPDNSFAVPAVAGEYNLYALSFDGRAAIRHGIDVGHRDLELKPAIDFDREGAALTLAPITITNPQPGDFEQDVTYIEDTTSLSPVLIEDTTDGALVLPNAVLTDTDLQTVSAQSDLFISIDDTTTRDLGLALRHPFRAGDDGAYTLPPQITGAAWTTAGGQPVASWTSLPTFSAFVADVTGVPAGGGQFGEASYTVQLTPAYVAATGITRVGPDLALPGFDPAWTLDLTQQYSLDLTAQLALGFGFGDILTSEVTDFVFPGFGDAARAARPAQRERPAGSPIVKR